MEVAGSRAGDVARRLKGHSPSITMKHVRVVFERYNLDDAVKKCHSSAESFMENFRACRMVCYGNDRATLSGGYPPRIYFSAERGLFFKGADLFQMEIGYMHKGFSSHVGAEPVSFNGKMRYLKPIRFYENSV